MIFCIKEQILGHDLQTLLGYVSEVGSHWHSDVNIYYDCKLNILRFDTVTLGFLETVMGIFIVN